VKAYAILYKRTDTKKKKMIAYTKCRGFKTKRFGEKAYIMESSFCSLTWKSDCPATTTQHTGYLMTIESTIEVFITFKLGTNIQTMKFSNLTCGAMVDDTLSNMYGNAWKAPRDSRYQSMMVTWDTFTARIRFALTGIVYADTYPTSYEFMCYKDPSRKAPGPLSSAAL